MGNERQKRGLGTRVGSAKYLIGLEGLFDISCVELLTSLSTLVGTCFTKREYMLHVDNQPIW